jgi:hypothetical protein
MSDGSVYLVRTATGEAVEATLSLGIGELQITDTENLWSTWAEAYFEKFNNEPPDESGHWKWRDKAAYIEGQLAYQSFSITCEGQTQGLMILSEGNGHLDTQKGHALTYVDMIAAAPWNRASFKKHKTRFTGVGSVLINVAIQVSIDCGFEGRIGLHSLKQSEKWYRDHCGMTDIGIDQHKQGLRYFEMTPAQAKTFIASTQQNE